MTEKKKTGPKKPFKPFDKRAFEKLCEIHCNQKEIADTLGISIDKLRDDVVKAYGEKFMDVFRRFQSGGKISIRREIWQEAMGDSKHKWWALKHLSDNLLGTADHVEVQATPFDPAQYVQDPDMTALNREYAEQALAIQKRHLKNDDSF